MESVLPDHSSFFGATSAADIAILSADVKSALFVVVLGLALAVLVVVVVVVVLLRLPRLSPPLSSDCLPRAANARVFASESATDRENSFRLIIVLIIANFTFLWMRNQAK